MDKPTKYSIEFADGTTLEDAILNGSNYVVDSTDAKATAQAADTTTVTVTGTDGSTVVYDNPTVNAQIIDGSSYISFTEMSSSEKYNLGIEARLSYLEMTVGGAE